MANANQPVQATRKSVSNPKRKFSIHQNQLNSPRSRRNSVQVLNNFSPYDNNNSSHSRKNSVHPTLSYVHVDQRASHLVDGDTVGLTDDKTNEKGHDSNNDYSNKIQADYKIGLASSVTVLSEPQKLDLSVPKSGRKERRGSILSNANAPVVTDPALLDMKNKHLRKRTKLRVNF